MSEEIFEKFKRWMDHDIEAMISGGCNVSCATLLGIFMEVLGRISEFGKGKNRQDRLFNYHVWY